MNCSKIAALSLLMAGTALGAGSDAASGTWTNTGSAASSIVSKLVALADGGALRVHSDGSSEMYDPTSNSFKAVDSLDFYPYFDFSLTLLNDGRVLLEGAGFYATGAPAELFDPATSHWTATGATNINRVNSVATLLANGTVMIAGGYNLTYCSGGPCGEYSTPTTEIYNPSTGAWTLGGEMAIDTAGYPLSAQRLPNGKVLVVGGPSYNSTESQLYDPTSQTWKLSGGVVNSSISEYATVSLSDGRVLAVANGDCGNQGGASRVCSSAQIYDSSTDRWTSTKAPSTARGDFSLTTLPGGKVLISGGYIGPYISLYNPITHQNYQFVRFTAAAEIFDATSEKWSTTTSMSIARESPEGVALTNGNTLIVGGYSAENSNYLASGEFYTP